MSEKSYVRPSPININHTHRSPRSQCPRMLCCVLTYVLSACLVLVVALKSDESLMFGLQTNVLDAPTTESYLRYSFSRTSSQWLEEVTVCVRVKVLQYRELVPFFSYSYSDQADNGILMYQKLNELHFYYNDLKETSGKGLTVDDHILYWRLNCFVGSHPLYRVYTDDILVSEGRMEGHQGPIPLNGTLYLGQEQDKLAGGTDALQSLSGYVAQFNIWNYTVDESEIRRMAKCEANPRGNVLSLDVNQFEEMNVKKEVIPISHFCNHQQMFVVYPLEKYIWDSRDFCNRLNARLFLPEDEISNIRLFNESSRFSETCDSRSYRRLFLGAKGEGEGSLRRWISESNSTLAFTAWAPGEPNSGANDNCIVLRNDMPLWGDVQCILEQCFACGTKKSSFVFLRGLCRPTEHEIRFLIDGYVNNWPYFRGYYAMAIYNSGDGYWLFKDTVTNLTLADMKMSHPSHYPIGRSHWKVLQPFCDFSPGDDITLGLSACTTREFMCSDGSCVPREVRCNLREDCRDGSDEEGCGIVHFSGRYANHRPPPGKTFKDVLHIQPHVRLVRFSKVDDISLAIYLECEVYLTWTDRNLQYKNIKGEEAKNQLSEDEVQAIWSPKIEFLNVNDGLLKYLKSGIFARRTGEPQPSDYNDVKMDTVYDSVSAKLVQMTAYSASFSCNFYLFKYPFDIQECTVLIKLASADVSVIDFANASVTYSGPTKLPKYEIMRVYVQQGDSAGYATLEVLFTLERRWSLLVLTIFLPTILLLGIGYVTLHVKLAAFQVRAIMTLTTLLVLYTLFNQVSSDLPDTAYIKMIDMWFFFCIFLIFSVIVIHAVVEHLPPDRPNELQPSPKSIQVAPLMGEVVTGRERNRLTGKFVMKVMSHYVYPVIICVFNLVFWLAVFNL